MLTSQKKVRSATVNAVTHTLLQLKVHAGVSHKLATGGGVVWQEVLLKNR